MFLLLQDDENAKLSAKMKELEEDRARLQKTTNIQQTQIEKHRALAEESAKKCDGLQLQVSGLHKVCVKSNQVKIFLNNKLNNPILHYSCLLHRK